MFDTNQINQLGETAQVIKTQLNPWLPALTIAAAWLGGELNRLAAWSQVATGKVIAHGGLIKILTKIFWNKNP
jgi:hypothetical protein